MSDGSPGEVTVLLRAVAEGQPGAADDLLTLVYGELRSIARREMSRAVPDELLQPTALVHEAYVRLFGKTVLDWKNRGHFYWAAARAMRDILVEHARRCQAIKRGGNRRRVAFDEDVAVWQQSEQLLTLSEALERLEQAHPQHARVVLLRMFGGLNHEETAALIGVSEQTVRRRWTFARAWLHRAISGSPANDARLPASVSAFAPDRRLESETIDDSRGSSSNVVR